MIVMMKMMKTTMMVIIMIIIISNVITTRVVVKTNYLTLSSLSYMFIHSKYFMCSVTEALLISSRSSSVLHAMNCSPGS